MSTYDKVTVEIDFASNEVNYYDSLGNDITNSAVISGSFAANFFKELGQDVVGLNNPLPESG